MSPLRRRDLLAGTVLALLQGGRALGGIIRGQLPWQPAPAYPPPPYPSSSPAAASWQFFTPAEAAMVEALADRLIPPDPQTPGGREAGCAVFVDRQLAGPYGANEGLYERPPFRKGSKQQGPQSPTTPAQLYRAALPAVDAYCRDHYSGRGCASLSAAQQDEVLRGLESGEVKLQGADGETFFQALLKDVQTGFFADPIYGGNRGMCAWKMIGFPGARYDYRDWVDRHNQRYPNPPVSIAGRADWTPRGG